MGIRDAIKAVIMLLRYAIIDSLYRYPDRDPFARYTIEITYAPDAQDPDRRCMVTLRYPRSGSRSFNQLAPVRDFLRYAQQAARKEIDQP